MISKNEESSWQKASASLDATAKIYGFRVDSVHSETYKFLGGLNRNKKDANLKNGDIQEEVDETKKKEKVKRGVNTLETNIKKLNLSKYDIDSEVDPLFSIMTSKFNESSVKGLLLNTIPLNDNLNYILESKKEENEILTPIENKLEDNKQDDSINDNESLSNELSQGSGSIKIKDCLLLANDLQKKDGQEKNNGENNLISVFCSKDFENVNEEILNVLKSFIKDNNIDDFVKLQICPDLTIFRESRKLFNGDSNTTFINTFKEELNLSDKKMSQNNFNENNNSIIDEEGPDNLPIEGEEIYDEIPEGTSQNSNNDVNSVENNDRGQNYDNNESGLNTISSFNPKNNDSTFTVFRYEDLIERAGQFGTGNTQFLPEFMNFARNFGKLEKNNNFNKGSILGLNKGKEGERKKKEEKTFLFNERNEININDLFSDIKTKALNKVHDYAKNNKKRKIKKYFHFDKFSQFKLFTITGKTITSKDIDNDLEMAKQENNLMEIKEDNDMFDGGETDNQNDNDIIGFEKNSEYDSFYQNEKKIEKNFGKLYRKFDIRTLKKKIWISYEDIREDKIDFKNVVTHMSINMDEDELFSISTPTCFVCMLHLCNEKNLFIQQKDMNTFYIEKDSNGNKSTKSSEKKNSKSSYNDGDDSETKDMDIDK